MRQCSQAMTAHTHAWQDTLRQGTVEVTYTLMNSMIGMYDEHSARSIRARSMYCREFTHLC